MELKCKGDHMQRPSTRTGRRTKTRRQSIRERKDRSEAMAMENGVGTTTKRQEQPIETKPETHSMRTKVRKSWIEWKRTKRTVQLE
jgi:hypothetical protein